MRHFLLVYDRDAGTLVRTRSFANRANAMKARFLAEAEFRDRREVEVVVLDAESKEALVHTHGRYFLGLTELADRIAKPAA
jgi:hypothetical protein